MRLLSRVILASVGALIALGMLSCSRGPDDATLAANVKSKLAADSSVASSGITVVATNGAVTLTGEVRSESEKAAAEQIAKSVEGVKSVSNNLTVRPPATPPPVSPDVTLRTDVTANLAKYGITTVTVDVANGEVTLTGNIPRAKLQDAIKAANESHPKKVNNKMVIK